MPGAQISVRRMLPVRGAEVEGSRSRRRFWGSRVAKSAAPLAPRGVGQILDLACDTLSARVAACVVSGAVLMLPVQIATELFLRAPLTEVTFFASIVGESGFVVVAQFIATAFVCKVIGAYLIGETAPPGEVVRLVLRKLPGIVVLSIGVGLVTYLGTLCCCVPGVVARWLSSVLAAVYVLEEGWFGRAVSRGVFLAVGWGNLGRWLGWASASALALAPLYLISDGLYDPDVRAAIREYLPLDEGPTAVLLTFPAALFAGVALGARAVLTVVYYYDLRIRKEGMDLERELARLVARAEEGVH